MKNDPFSEFIRLFNEQAFFEAHEVLEGLWREADAELRDFYQGLIQIAAVFVHISKHNRFGALNLFQKAGLNLGKYPDHFHGVDAGRLMRDTRNFLAKKDSDFPRIVLLPEK